MKENFMFESMEFKRNRDKMKEWFPLIADGRGKEEIMAAVRIDRGTEMNFGALTKQLFEILKKEYDTKVMFNCQVKDIDPDGKIDWTVEVEDRLTFEEYYFDAAHVFI
jgi:malate dehydrogenase (quinone)